MVTVRSVRRTRSRVADPGGDRRAVGQPVGEEQLAGSRGVRGVAPADDGGQPDRALGRVDLRPVDDGVVVEHGVVGGLAVPLGQRLQDRTDPHVVGAALVVGEGQPQELVAEQVAAAAVLDGEPGAAQRAEGAVDRGLGAPDGDGDLLEADALGYSASAASTASTRSAPTSRSSASPPRRFRVRSPRCSSRSRFQMLDQSFEKWNR